MWDKNTAKKYAQSCLPEFTPADLVTDILPVLWDHLLLGTGGFCSTRLEWAQDDTNGESNRAIICFYAYLDKKENVKLLLKWEVCQN